MKILITGCAGLLGAHLSRYLLTKNYEVYGLDDLSGGYLENVPKIPFFQIDLQDHEKVEILFKKIQFDIVYHFAAYAS